MSQNQFIAVVAALVILFAIFVWAVARKGGQEADFTAATAGTFATDASTAAAALTVVAWLPMFD